MSWYLGDETQDSRLLGLWEYNILKIYLASELYSMILLSKVVWDPLRNISASAFLEYCKSLTVCQCMNSLSPEFVWEHIISFYPTELAKSRDNIGSEFCLKTVVCMHGPTWFMLRLADKTVHMCSAPLYVLSRVTSWYSSFDLVNMDHRHVLLLLGYHLKYFPNPAHCY